MWTRWVRCMFSLGPQEVDGKPFEASMRRLVAERQTQQVEGARLDAAIAENFNSLGFRGNGP